MSPFYNSTKPQRLNEDSPDGASIGANCSDFPDCLQARMGGLDTGTLARLSIAFAAGHLLSLKIMDALFRRLGVGRNVRILDDAFGSKVNSDAPGRRVRRVIVAILPNHRYLTLAILLNCPANAVIGGDGGLALLNGMSPEITWLRFFLTIALATAPPPILVLLGLMNVEPLLRHHGFIHDLLTTLKQFLP